MKYTFHWRGGEQPILFTDIVFRPMNYGRVDYRVLVKGDLTASYLTEQGVRQAYTIGKKLQPRDIVGRLIKMIKKAIETAKDDSILNRKTAYTRDRKKTWEIVNARLNDFGRLYFYCEQPVLKPLEDILLAECGSQEEVGKLFERNQAHKQLSKKVSESLKTVQTLGQLKLEMHEQFSPWVAALYKIASQVAKDFRLTLEQTSALRADEMRQILHGAARPSARLLNGRLKGVVLLPGGKGGKWRLLSGRHYLYWEKRLEGASSSVIKGQPAYPGVVQGVVNIHTRWLSSANIPPGAILVATNTNPQIVPLMKQVKAIVTDEGGLTCHAAILARELKIPCIVGTRNATMVFKDGDRVEVDAERGIVKKLNQ